MLYIDMKNHFFVYTLIMNQKYLFWITGLSGSGKTSIAKLIHKSVIEKYGPTIEISGDELRNNFLFKNYDIESRKIYAKSYSKFCKLLLKKNFNVIFSTVSLFHEVQKWNKKNIKGYYEIFINSEIKNIIKLNKKKIYKNKENIVGVNLDAEFPKKPDFLITNNFTKDIKIISKQIEKNIFKNCK